MCGEISMAPVGSSGAQAGVKSKQPPQTKTLFFLGASNMYKEFVLCAAYLGKVCVMVSAAKLLNPIRS
ncbi:hypothetical protein ScPMuIL_002575 [Solemya velum]